MELMLGTRTLDHDHSYPSLMRSAREKKNTFTVCASLYASFLVRAERYVSINVYSAPASSFCTEPFLVVTRRET